MAISKATASSIAPAAKGDLVAGSATNDAAVLAVGANDTVLTADSAEATGLKWAAIAGGGMTSIASGNFSGAGSSLSITGIPSGYVNLYLVCSNFNTTGGAGSILIRFNSDTGGNYANHNLKSGNLTQYVNGNEFNLNQDHTTTSNARFALNVLVSNYADTTAYKQVSAQFFKGDADGDFSSGFGGWIDTNAITSIQIGTSGGTYAGGTYNLYGVK
jgi:trimeric autotransporter adhesin